MKKDNKKKKGTKATLHLSRVRSKGEPLFFDPQTDIRKLIPAMAKVAILSLQDQCKDATLLNDFKYIHSCICVFQIRVLEDPTPIAEQIQKFFEAVNSVSQYAFNLWTQAMFGTMFSVYGLFCRRDAVADSEALRGIMEYSKLASYKDVLSPETYSRMEQELRLGGVITRQQNETQKVGAIKCHETKEVLHNIQAIAHMFINCTGDTSWEALSAACDEAFMSGMPGTDTKTRIAVALAYPAYGLNTLTVEAPADAITGEA